MTVLLFTSEEPLYLPRYLEPVLAAHAPSIDAVVIAPPPSPARTQLRRQLRMLGPAGFTRIGSRFAGGTLLGALPATIDRRLTGRYHSVASAAAAHDVPVERAADVSDDSVLRLVRECEPELILSVVCGQLIPRNVRDVATAAINLHGSLLPKYRGRATGFWPLYYGDEESGVTAHLLTDEFDAGPIVEKRSFSIRDDDTMHDVYLKIAETGAELAIDLVDRPVDGFETRPNPTTPNDYHTIPGAEERRDFRRRGNEFI